MNRRLLFTTLTVLCWLATTGSAIAGPFDVTFQVPLNLTKLATDITKVRVFCEILSAALVTGNLVGGPALATEVPVSAGQVVSTATVVIPINSLDTSKATSAQYHCQLEGFSQTLQRWYPFSETATDARFRLSPTPGLIPASGGTFTW